MKRILQFLLTIIISLVLGISASLLIGNTFSKSYNTVGNTGVHPGTGVSLDYRNNGLTSEKGRLININQQDTVSLKLKISNNSESDMNYKVVLLLNYIILDNEKTTDIANNGFISCKANESKTINIILKREQFQFEFNPLVVLLNCYSTEKKYNFAVRYDFVNLDTNKTISLPKINESKITNIMSDVPYLLIDDKFEDREDYSVQPIILKYVPNQIKSLFLRINKYGMAESAIILIVNGKQLNYNNNYAIVTNNREKYFEKIKYSVVIPENQKDVQAVALAIPTPEEKINEESLNKYNINASQVCILEEGDNIVEESK
jgi:hypothetical protein